MINYILGLIVQGINIVVGTSMEVPLISWLTDPQIGAARP